jgi:poly(A) polymerase
LLVALPELKPMLEEAEIDLSARLGREKDLWDHTVRVVRQSPQRLAVRWAALLHDAAKPLTRGIDVNGEVHFYGHEHAGASLAMRLLHRLNADKSLRGDVSTLVALHGRPAAYDEAWTDSAVRRLALEAGSVWSDLLDLAAADVTSGRARKQLEAAQRVANLRNRFRRLEDEAQLERLVSPLDGDQLMRIFGLPPGPWIKRVKDQLRELVIDGALAPNDEETATRIARNLIDASASREERRQDPDR